MAVLLLIRVHMLFIHFFYQNECPVIDTSGDIPQVVIDNEEGKEAWNYICDLISKGGLVESFKEATTWDKVYESFANGEATFLLGGDWCSSEVENPAWWKLRITRMTCTARTVRGSAQSSFPGNLWKTTRSFSPKM